GWSIQRDAESSHRLYSQRGLYSHCRGVRGIPWHTHCADGFRPARRWFAFAEREIPHQQLLHGHHDHRSFPRKIRGDGYAVNRGWKARPGAYGVVVVIANGGVSVTNRANHSLTKLFAP